MRFTDGAMASAGVGVNGSSRGKINEVLRDETQVWLGKVVDVRIEASSYPFDLQ